VDDLVQESLLRIVRGLPELQQPHAYRSWMVAIVVRQIRDWIRRQQQLRSRHADLHQLEDHSDPASDFTSLTILELGLADQRRELAEATRWLDPDDRDLMALWWLEETGELTRADLTTALELSGRHTAVRIQRMKQQITTARQVVRALAAVPRCAELAEVVAGWDGSPSPLWRKRLARHIRDCDGCAPVSDPLIPVEGLLGGLPLLAPPTRLYLSVSHVVGQASAPHPLPGGGGAHARATRSVRTAGTHKLLLAGAAATATAVIATVAVAADRHPAAPPSAPTARVAAATPGPLVPSASPTATRSASPSPQVSRGAAALASPAVPSGKKGVAVWSFPGDDQALAQVRPSWYYTWGPQHSGLSSPTGTGFVPMIWGAASVTPQVLAQARRSGPYLLGFNEPDMGAQANMTVQQAITLWPQLMATGRVLGSPAVAYGGDTPGGWLDRFMTAARQHDYRVDFIALHWYGGDFTTPDAVDQLRSYLAAVHARYHKPIWLTEFALIDFSHGTRYPTDSQQAAFLSAAGTMLDGLTYVQRYAWFGLGTADANPGTTLVRSGSLTPEGRAYESLR
jgi:RNA polymerase sigma factor (sigma-70 family)